MTIKKLLPKRLFSRLLAIVMVPMVTVQIVTVLVFYERHWDTVTRYMASNLASDIAVIVDQYAQNQTPDQFEDTSFYAWDYFYFGLDWAPNAILQKSDFPAQHEYAGVVLEKSLKDRLSYPYAINLSHTPERLAVFVQFLMGSCRSLLTVNAFSAQHRSW